MGQDGEKILKEMLEVAGIPEKPSYNSTEVCAVLGISPSTFRRMCREYETINGAPKPGTIDSFVARGSLRIRFHELVRYLEDNNTYRLECEIELHQLKLFN